MRTAWLVLLAAAGLAGAGERRPEGPQGIKAVTEPSEDRTVLGFTFPGRIAKVLVKEGQYVQAGQPLIQLDDAVERVELEMLKAKAEDSTRVRAAELRLKRARVVLGKVRKAYQDKAASKRELEEATLAAAMAELELEIARLERRQAQGRYRQAVLKLERMRLLSPVAGRIERLLVRAGESIKALAPVARIVQVNPLRIEVPVPMARARGIRPGQAARVRFADGAGGAAEGRVVRLSSVADAGSGTLAVRVEVPNPAGRPAGEQVTVEFIATGAPGPSSRAARLGPARSGR